MARFRLRRRVQPPERPKTAGQIVWEGFLFGGKPMPVEYASGGGLLIAEKAAEVVLAKSFLATLEDTFLNGTSNFRPVGLIRCEPIVKE